MKALKWLLLGLLLLVLLVVGAGALLVATVDPNDFKDDIAAQVQKRTGRTLRIAGDIRWSFYPWLGLDLGPTELGNAPGFGERPFASFERVDVHVALLPLLKKRVEAKDIVLHGVTLNLARDARGRDNWSDLARAGREPAEKAEKPAAGGPARLPVELRIAGLRLVDARIRYSDAQSGTRLRIEPLNLRAGPLALGQPMPARLDLTAHLQDGPTVTLHLDGRFTLDPERKRYLADADLRAELALPGTVQAQATLRGHLKGDAGAGRLALSGLTVDGVLRGDGLPADGLPVQARADLKADQHKQTLDLAPLHLAVAGVTLDGQLAVRRFIDAPRYQGRFETNAFSPRELLRRLGITPPATRDPAVLGKAQLRFTLHGDRRSLALDPLQASLDDSQLSGSLKVADLARQALRFDLTLDRIDLDRYLPPPAPAGKAGQGGQGGAGDTPIALPLDTLRKLDLAGTARIRHLTVHKLVFEDATLTLRARDGVLEVKPLAARAYRGKAHIEARLDVRRSPPRYQARVDLTGVRSEEILQTLFGDRYLSGAADFHARLHTAGATVGALERGLNGEFQARFSEGTIKGSRLARKITEARNFWRRLQGKPPLGETPTDRTRFTRLTASGKITQGVIRNDDLRIIAPVFQARGEGRVDLPARRLDYTVSLAQPGEKARTYIPLNIQGPFDHLRFKLRLDEVAKQRAKAELERKKAKLKAELEAKKKAKAAELRRKAEEKEAELRRKAKEKEQQLQERLQQQLQEKLKGKLKGLF